MPQNSIWVPGPAAPLDLSPRGVWLGCWLGQADNVDHCKVTDYQGNVQFDEQFLPANGAAPVALERLHLKQIGTVELWTWVEEDKRNVPIVPLGDGTILVPARDVGVLRGRRAP